MATAPHDLAGQPVPTSMRANIPRLLTAYYALRPDTSDPSQRVAFGTSGHRGQSYRSSFNEHHVLAICQAICEYRKSCKITGPLFLGMDTHALSEGALSSAIEVFAGNEVTVQIDQGRRYTPTPVISHAILTFNRGRRRGLADGVVITPSHNPPEHGGLKYNPPHGGPADPDTTRVIESRANEILAQGLRDVRRIPYSRARRAGTTLKYDYVGPFVTDLESVIDMQVIADERLRIGVDPMGGSAIDFWDPIVDHYGVSIDVVNRVVDPTFAFMTLDVDGQIRMDCSSAFAMAGLIRLRDRFDVAFGNDPDADRHGIVTRGHGLLNPNHFLAVAVWYLFRNRPAWSREAAVGKTLVSSAIIDRVTQSVGRRLVEVPVGFKWFVDGLLEGSLGFGGEESAGGCFLRRDGTVWCTDKDGIIMGLLACEMTARLGKDPGDVYEELAARFGDPVYERIDAPANKEQKRVMATLSPAMITAQTLAGEPIQAKLTHAPGNGAPIGGLKVVAANGWFAARPSGTEEIYKIYAESFLGPEHLERIKEEAQGIVHRAFGDAQVQAKGGL